MHKTELALAAQPILILRCAQAGEIVKNDDFVATSQGFCCQVAAEEAAASGNE
jgi:hypothetical protein